MTSPSSRTLEELEHLDSSSEPEFSRQLDHFLQREGYDLMTLVNYLDQFVDDPSPSGPIRETCLSKLKKICSTKRVLPSSCNLSSQCLEIHQHPFATGGFGDVFEATLNGADVRVKRVRVPRPGGLNEAGEKFCGGVVMWMRLKNQHIVSPIGATLDPLQLISDWMPNGDLTEYIKNHPEAHLIDLLCGVMKGIQYLHSRGVIHREIKGSNVLVDAAGNPRIVDFGLGLITSRDNFAIGPYQAEYSPRWTAPEVLSHKESSTAADIFSFAMLMVEVFTGAIPLEELTGFKAGLAIVEGTRPPRPGHAAFTDELWELMQECWNPDPQLRPDAEKVLSVLENRASLDSPSLSHVSPETTPRESCTSSAGSPRPDRSQLEGSLPSSTASPGGYRRLCVII